MASTAEFVVIDKKDADIEVIGKYRIISVLGSGGMGVVYKARDPEVGRDVAIKTLKKLQRSNRDESDEALRRFRLEARSAGNLRHPNIVAVYEANYQDDIPYIVMECVEGEGLDAILRREGKLAPKIAFHYLDQIAGGLDYAHGKGVIHRDIKPSNILVDKGGHAYLLDFGVANLNLRLSGVENKKKDKQIFGSPGYMAPEQILGEEIDNRCDIFSLAAVAYEALTGQKPFQGASVTQVLENTIQGNRPSVTELNPLLNLSLEVEFERALNPNRARRFTNAENMMVAFMHAIGQAPARSAGEIPLSFSTKADRAADGVSKLVLDPQPEQKRRPEKKNLVDAGAAQQQATSATDRVPTGAVAWSLGSGRPSLKATELYGFSEKRVERNTPGRMFASGDLDAGSTSPVANPSRRFVNPLVYLGAITLFAASLAVTVVSNRSVKLGTGPGPARAVSASSAAKGSVGTIPSELVMPRIEIAPAHVPVDELKPRELLGVLVSKTESEERILGALDEAQRRTAPQLIDALAFALENPSTRVKLAVVRMIGELEDRRIVPHLLVKLEDPDRSVRLETARTLSSLGERKTLDYLRFRFLAESDPEVKTALKATIERIGGIPLDEQKLRASLGRG